MKIPIGNLTITSYCVENINHIHFRKDMMKDELIYEFVSTDIESDLLKIQEMEEFKLGYFYVIEDYKRPVESVYIGSIENISDIVELRYAVHPEYRRLGYIGYSNFNRKGYGQQILEECRDYLFTLNGIKGVELHIRKDNEASIGCAQKSKYKCIGTNEEYYYYIYRSLKGNMK